MGNMLLRIEAVHNKNFKVINTTCVEDTNLSWKAKGIHNYFITRPAGWKINNEDLIRRSPDGTSSLRSGIKELLDHHYLYRANQRANGKISAWMFLALEIPAPQEEAQLYLNECLPGWNIYTRKNDDTEDSETPGSTDGNSIVGFSNYRESPSLINNNINNEQKENKKNTSSKEEVEWCERTTSPHLKPASPLFKEEGERNGASKPYRKLRKKQHSLTRRQRVQHQSMIDSWITLRNEEDAGREKQLQAQELASKVEQAQKSVPENIAVIIEHWESLGLKPVNPQKAPKTYLRTVKMIKKAMKGDVLPGKPKLKEEEIKLAMTNFSLAALDLNFEPSDLEKKNRLAKMNLAEFIYSPMAKHNFSLLYRYHEEPPRKSFRQQPIIEDPNPKITNQIKRFYINYALGGIKPPAFKEAEENKFRLAAKQIMDFYKENQYKIQGLDGGTMELAEFLCDAIKDQYGENVEKVYPGSFCSAAALSCLIKRLNSEGMIEESYSAVPLYDVDTSIYHNKKQEPQEDDYEEAQEKPPRKVNPPSHPYGNGDPPWMKRLEQEQEQKLHLQT